MASGISVEQECVDSFQEQKQGGNHRFISYMITGDRKRIIVEQKFEKNLETEEFLKRTRTSEFDPEESKTQFEAQQKKEWEMITNDEACVPPNDCRWISADMSYVGKGNTYTDKIVFISWCPDSASIKSKMCASASIDALKKKLTITSAHIQANDFDDIKYDNIIAFLKTH